MAVGLHNITKASWWDHIIAMCQHEARSAKQFSKCYSTVRIHCSLGIGRVGECNEVVLSWCSHSPTW